MQGLRRATKCKYCQADIAFIKTPAGKSIPVDPEPILFWGAGDDEKFVLDDGRVMSGVRIDPAESVEGPGEWIGYRSHFATCPYAEEARRKKNKKERVKG